MSEQIKEKARCPYCREPVDVLDFYPVLDRNDRWWHFTCAQKILSNYN